jgi:hypothetical protein
MVRPRSGEACENRLASEFDRGGAMAELLSAEKVMEREKQRFQERYERAQKEADEAKEQVEKLEQALKILRDGSGPDEQ